MMHVAFRMIPCPLERGHMFYTYPTSTESADRELLPCELFTELQYSLQLWQTVS